MEVTALGQEVMAEYFIQTVIKFWFTLRGEDAFPFISVIFSKGHLKCFHKEKSLLSKLFLLRVDPIGEEKCTKMKMTEFP